LVKKSLLRHGAKVPTQLTQPLKKKRDAKADEKLDEKNFKVWEHLLTNERKMHSRHTVMQCPNRSFLKVL